VSGGGTSGEGQRGKQETGQGWRRNDSSENERARDAGSRVTALDASGW
jgi:hypothetical protein